MSSLSMCVPFEQEFSIFNEFGYPSHLFIELRIYYDVEIIIDLFYLDYVFILHLPSGHALPAGVFAFWETNLVNHNVMYVYLKLG